jgi:hypothetical protein
MTDIKIGYLVVFSIFFINFLLVIVYPIYRKYKLNKKQIKEKDNYE